MIYKPKSDINYGQTCMSIDIFLEVNGVRWLVVLKSDKVLPNKRWPPIPDGRTRDEIRDRRIPAGVLLDPMRCENIPFFSTIKNGFRFCKTIQKTVGMNMLLYKFISFSKRRTQKYISFISTIEFGVVSAGWVYSKEEDSCQRLNDLFVSNVWKVTLQNAWLLVYSARCHWFTSFVFFSSGRL